MLAHQIVQTEDVVEFTIKQQPTIRADLRAVEFEADTTVETKPIHAHFAYTLWVSHRHAPPMPSTHWNICDLQCVWVADSTHYLGNAGLYSVLNYTSC